MKKVRIVTEYLERIRYEGSFSLDLPDPEILRQRRKSTRIDSASHINAHTYSSAKGRTIKKISTS